MDILFITASDRIKLNSVSNGIMLLSTILIDAGFDVDIMRFCQFKSHKINYTLFIKEITSEISRLNPKIVSFYTLWPYYHIMLRIAKELKIANCDTIIVFGGPHSSATAENTMKACTYVDYICTGEGEETVVPFFSAVLKNYGHDLSTVPGLYYRKNGLVYHNDIPVPLCNLNTLPYWNRSLISACNPQNESDIHSPTYYMPVDVGRGCPFSCTYCATSNFWHRTYRLKSPERIVAEIKHFNQAYGIKSFYFSHDAFTVNKQLVSQVCKMLQEDALQIVWKCTTRVDCISEPLILEMKQAGLRAIEMGIETGSQRMQTIINKKLNLGNALQTIKSLIKNNIDTSVFFIYGFPEETEEDINLTLNFLFDCLDLGVLNTSFNLCRFAPGTKLTEQYYDELSLDSNCKILFYGDFGVEDEMKIIQANKQLFSNYYNLRTPIRKDYQYLYFFQLLYKNQRVLMSFLRSYYQNNMTAFYKDFLSTNSHMFNDLNHTANEIKQNPLSILHNMIQKLDHKCRKLINELIRFHNDIEQVKKSPNGASLQTVYGFNYLDYLEKTPIREFYDCKTELQISKEAEKIDIQLIDFRS